MVLVRVGGYLFGRYANGPLLKFYCFHRVSDARIWQGTGAKCPLSSSFNFVFITLIFSLFRRV